MTQHVGIGHVNHGGTGVFILLNQNVTENEFDQAETGMCVKIQPANILHSAVLDFTAVRIVDKTRSDTVAAVRDAERRKLSTLDHSRERTV
jgi:hypothetical protein